MTISFLSRLSSRYSRLIAADIAHLAGEVVDNAEKANKTYPSGDINMNVRAAHLAEARASLSALDVRLSHCYTILMQNPQGSFSKSLSPADATRRLDHMAQELGELINKEDLLIMGVIKNDRKKIKQ